LAEEHGLTNMLIVEGLGQDRSETLQAAVPALPITVRGHLGAQLQAAYDTFITNQPPQRLLDLIAKLDSALTTHVSENARAFRQSLIEALPALRAFALSLVA
jgi:RNA polymerase sigma-70 factor, ECF subfamily